MLERLGDAVEAPQGDEAGTGLFMIRESGRRGKTRRFGDRSDPVDRGWGAAMFRLLPPAGRVAFPQPRVASR